MPEEKNEPSGFKVVDRRSFSEDGSRREEKPAEDIRHEARATAARPSAPPEPARQPAPEPEEEAYFEDEGASFATLVSYLSTTAMFQLGLLPGPGGERIPADFANARRTIDLLEVLQEKTQGNLTPEEARMIEEVLYELRLTFVEAEQRRGPGPR
ncbi:MAG TPA: DUF1844 domain-containing protein [Terriglobia bacterium]|nr:DUF1844 domain-containing protein [Terriglobia bacterium]